MQVSGLSGVVAIAGGYVHSLALKSDGTVWAWGSNYSGQLGDGTTTNRSTPVEVSGLNLGVTTSSNTGVSSLTFELNDYEPQPSDETLAGNDAYEQNITLYPITSARITGNAIGKDGEPIATARVKLSLKGVKTKFRNYVTGDKDAEGYFEFSNLEAGTYVLRITANGYQQVEKMLRLSEGQQAELEIVLVKTRK